MPTKDAPAKRINAAGTDILVKAEETVFSGRYSNNGASPMWCLGNTCIARLGEDVFVSAYEWLPGQLQWPLYGSTEEQRHHPHE